MHARMRTTVSGLLATGIALAVAVGGTAVADTNKSQQTSSISGPTAALLSPAAAHPDSSQANRQTTHKADTTNWAVIDYFGNSKRSRFYESGNNYDQVNIALI
ncbi:hypothetical protein [Streptomyces poonensis]|uniref:Uncharacterized protein n=1 Tax=Streptomyces poonensis TaxID=68255 RepID=A0A918Q2G3_9ACTN|nr:hypothetical protein [Streptomyces poonensis]GGZ29459.1 hypothetical protein GCM10010365_57250 [Streptomyces poonensis]